jgi:hypothetical protein
MYGAYYRNMIQLGFSCREGTIKEFLNKEALMKSVSSITTGLLVYL